MEQNLRLCAVCSQPITIKRLRKYCRGCLNNKKKLKEERIDTTRCATCKLFIDNVKFMEVKNFKSCCNCRESKNRRERKTEIRRRIRVARKITKRNKQMEKM